MRLHLYVYVYCTGMWCCVCVKPLFVCLALVLWLGRCGGPQGRSTRKVSSLPTLRGGPVRSRRTSHLDRPPGRPCRKSPGLFVLSVSHSLECDTNGACQSPRATSASLNANAGDELTTAGGLEAASKNAWGESTHCGGLEAVPSNASGRPTSWALELFHHGLPRGTHELDNPRLRRKS